MPGNTIQHLLGRSTLSCHQGKDVASCGKTEVRRERLADRRHIWVPAFAGGLFHTGPHLLDMTSGVLQRLNFEAYSCERQTLLIVRAAPIPCAVPDQLLRGQIKRKKPRTEGCGSKLSCSQLTNPIVQPYKTTVWIMQGHEEVRSYTPTHIAHGKPLPPVT
jgi:hypothetical protein